jgi:hypothetical protein
VTERDRVIDKINKKEQEIQSLEAQIREAKVYLQALQDVLKMFPRQAEADPATLLRAGSLVAKAREVILRNGAPMHVNDIVKAVGRDITRSNQTGLSGSIAAYVRKGEVFTRPAPNTFGLVELERANSGPKPQMDEPPDDFGQEPKPAAQSGGEFDDDIPF